MVKHMTPIHLDFTGFQPQVADKVICLLLVLDRLGAHPFAKSRLCLYGGTGLNLFVLGVPRLSVDIDLNYIGSADRARMLDERPAIEQAVMDAARDRVSASPQANRNTPGVAFGFSIRPDMARIT
jgi:hypothetical protein